MDEAHMLILMAQFTLLELFSIGTFYTIVLCWEMNNGVHSKPSSHSSNDTLTVIAIVEYEWLELGTTAA
jgi:hypothetical protein